MQFGSVIPVVELFTFEYFLDYKNKKNLSSLASFLQLSVTHQMLQGVFKITSYPYPVATPLDLAFRNRLHLKPRFTMACDAQINEK